MFEHTFTIEVYGFGGYFCGTACWWNRFDCMLTAATALEEPSKWPFSAFKSLKIPFKRP